MTAQSVKIKPFHDQKPGTSGLRKKTRDFMRPHYLESFIQAIFNAIGDGHGKAFVIGGDGRFFNAEAIQTIVKIAAANGATRLIIGQNGILSTPAASHLIRKYGTDGGFILSASHNPGGIDEDFGVKFNAANGGPAPEALTAKMFNETKTLSSYEISDQPDIDLTRIGSTKIGAMQVEIVDPVSDYLALIEELFDFNAISALFAGGFRMCFDAMHAVTGPYAHAILEDRLGAPKGTVVNGIPKEDFGKGHPDPNPIWAKTLMDLMMSDKAPDLGAASDGDGDRNMIVGRGTYVTPSDSLAVLAANAHLAPAYAKGLAGIARSMPTSAASDRVAARLGIGHYETPTGWKFFGNLLDADRVTICGEESAGTGSDHVREKDGLWAVLLWLNILAKRNLSVAQILTDHWATYGRDYYSRHDFEAIETSKADALVTELSDKLPNLPGQTFAGLTVTNADEFSYHDPVDSSVSTHQGLRVYFDGGGRAVFRLSGTGTEGATLRIYLEHYEPAEGDHSQDPQAALTPLRDAAYTLSRLTEHTGRSEPDVRT
ncbi:alpha-D-glucose phosphate-specific phosphoglucomutase [Pararhodobacter oceanensis]|uniref:alpha-D-glucose phosphate-specific phosphoglucomutase n=1 Tax=Pararhodobacter oceanensis TaxID=2172121 RepID=UPI003A91C290